MQKNKSSLYIIGCLMIGITVLLLLYMTLIFTGVIDMRENRLVVQAASAEKEYDGTPLSCSEWEIVEGKLRSGHRIKVTVEGTQTTVGTSPNQVFAQVLDTAGNDVTADYAMELRAGTLSVQGIRLVIRSGSATRSYNGEALTNSSWEFVSGRFLSGHHLGPVSVTGSITEVGEIPNAVSATVLDEAGNDVSQNYQITYETGTLCVNPIALTISTGTMEWVYTGDEYSHEEYTLATGSLFGGDSLNVEFLRSRQEIGKVANEVRITVTDEDGNDVTSRYDIELILGHLAVFSEFGDSDDIDADGLRDIFQDFDMDGIPDHWLDTDGDGKPDTAPNSPGLLDQDGNGVLDMYEDRDSNGVYDILEDINGDGYPDWWEDGNGDGMPDLPGSFTNLQEDGSIANNQDTIDSKKQNEDVIAATLYADYTGEIYLRFKSYGSYNAETGSWESAEVFDHAAYAFNPLYWSAATLLGNGYTQQNVDIQLNGKQRLEPYYTTTFSTTGNDVSIPLDNQYHYAVSYIPFKYVSNANPLSSDVLREEYRTLETDYFAFVSGQYLDVPEQTKAALESICQEYDLYEDMELVQKVARVAFVIQQYAVYDDEVIDPEGGDIVTYFLTESRAGVCRHFASAATLLYRYLGIPARYTVGYSAQTEAGKYVDVLGSDAHAWVEVYIEGLGWMQVEVTGGRMSDDESTDEIEHPKPLEKLSSDPNAINLYPYLVDVSKLYDGMPLVYPYSVIDETFYGNRDIPVGYPKAGIPKAGHTVYITTAGSQTNVGKSPTWITDVWVEDEEGRNVTNQYNLRCNLEELPPTMLTVKAIAITMVSGSASANIKDTDVLTCDTVTYTGTLLEGHSLEFEVTGKQEGLGKTENRFTYTFYETVDGEKREMSAADVKKYYTVYKPSYGSLHIYGGTITVTVYGGSKEYDGTPITATVSIDRSELGANHNIQPDEYYTYSLTNVGAVSLANWPNIVVTDSTKPGMNLAEHYRIVYVHPNGKSLQVTPATLKVNTVGNTMRFDFNDPKKELRPPETNSVEVVDESKLVTGHILDRSTLKATGVQVGMGSCDTGLDPNWEVYYIDANGKRIDVSKNYTIRVVDKGKLKITP